MQRAELEEARQREANETALLAIGPRKKLKTSINQTLNSSLNNSFTNNSSINVLGASALPFSNNMPKTPVNNSFLLYLYLTKFIVIVFFFLTFSYVVWNVLIFVIFNFWWSKKKRWLDLQCFIKHMQNNIHVYISIIIKLNKNR